MKVTAFDLAKNYLGVRELEGGKDHPLIQWWLSLCFDGKLDLHDEIAWCSAFCQGPTWELGISRSASARARSWLRVGRGIQLEEAAPGWDVVILNRGGSPDPSVLEGPGHVGFFAGLDGDEVLLLAGNQSNSVSVARFPVTSVLGVRRLYEEAAT